MFAPHLPPQTCNIERHHRLQRLKVLAIATIFGLFAGLAGAAVLVGWIWPTLGEGDAWIVSHAVSTKNRQLLQDRVQSIVHDTLFTIYSRSSAISGTNVVSLGAPIGTGVGVLSQGWIAVSVPSTVRTADLVVIGANGLSYGVTQSVVPKSGGGQFLRIARLVDGKPADIPEQLHTAVLADVPAALSDVATYYNGRWSATTIVDPLVAVSADAHTLSQPFFGYRSADMVDEGSWVFDSNGHLLGRINKGLTVPLAESAQALAQLVSGSAFTHPGLGVSGWYGEERPLLVNDQVVPGFLVSKVDALATTFKKGDILLTMNGEPFTYAAWRRIGVPSSVRLTLLRAGKTVEVTASVINE